MIYKLGFDIDEVVCKTINTIIGYLKCYYNIEWSYERFNSYSFEKTRFVKDKALNKLIADHLVRLVNDPDVHLSFEPYSGAIKYINKYKSKGHSIHFVSNRPFKQEDITIKWLKENGFPFDSLHHVGWKIKKGDICNDLELDFYIDDHIGCIDSILSHKRRYKKGLLLFDKPWNQGYKHSKVVRVHSWKEIDKHLDL